MVVLDDGLDSSDSGGITPPQPPVAAATARTAPRIQADGQKVWSNWPIPHCPALLSSNNNRLRAQGEERSTRATSVPDADDADSTAAAENGSQVIPAGQYVVERLIK